MGYLDLINDDEINEISIASNGSGCAPGYEINEIDEKTLDARPPCEHPLHLPESQALGRCVRCQSEAEFVDTLARIKIHHERTKRAVAARVKELEGGR